MAVAVSKFDPQGPGFDIETFKESGGIPDPSGHMGSLDPRTGMVLKGVQHPTFHKTIEAEEKLGNKIVRRGNRLFSVPKSAAGTPVNEFGDEVVEEVNEFGDPVGVSVIQPIAEPIPPEQAFDLMGRQWDAAIENDVPLYIAQQWFYDAQIAATDPDSFAEPVPDNRTGFSENFKDQWTFGKGITKIPVVGGVLGIKENIETIQAANRLLDEEFDYDAWNRKSEEVNRKTGAPGMVFTISRERDMELMAQAIKDLEFESKGKTVRGKVAVGVSQLPTWMIEFAATGGLASIGDDIAQRVGRKLLRKHVETLAGKAVLKTSGLVVGAVVRTSTGLLPRVGEKATERQALIALGVSGEEGWATSLSKAWGTIAIESLSEETGGLITKGLSKGLAKLPFGAKFMTGLQKEWSAITGGTADNFATKMLAKGGYSSIIGEIGEERLGTLLRELTGVSDREGNPAKRMWEGMKEDFDPENLAAEVITILAPASVRRGMTMGISLSKGPDVPTEAEQLDAAVGVGPIAFDTPEDAQGYAERVKKVAVREGEDVAVDVDPADNTVTVDEVVEPLVDEKGVQALSKTEGKPILSRSSIHDDIIRLSFDALGETPTAEELKEMLATEGVRLSVQRFETDIVSGTQGVVRYRVDVSDLEGRSSSKLAKEVFDTKIGTENFFRAETTLEREIPLKERFKAVQQAAVARQVGVVPAKAGEPIPKLVEPKPTKPKKPKAKPEPILVDGKDPAEKILAALETAKEVQPKTEAEKKAELRKRVGAAAGTAESLIRKGNPTREAVLKSTGLLKGPLTDYDLVFESIEDQLTTEEKEAAYQRIYSHPDLKYFGVLNTTTSLDKLLAGTALTPGDVKNIELVFGKTFKPITDVRQIRGDLYDKMLTLWKAGLLTGIKTSGINILSNTTHAISETAANIPGALIDRAISLHTGERALVLATKKGTVAGVVKGIKEGWKYFRTGQSERNVGAKLDYTDVFFGNSRIAKAFQAYEETIFHILGAEDQPFYYGMKATSITNQAVAKGLTKKLKGKELDAFVKDLIAHPTDKMLETSVHDAEIAVFQNQTRLGDAFGTVSRKRPFGFILPFTRTPAAIAMQIVRYTPVGLAAEVLDQIKKGEFNQRKFSQAFGRAAAGTGTMVAGGALFTAGLLTLDRPKDERERKLWELEGRKANSIKVGDEWRSVNTLGPIGGVVLMGGHFQRALKETGSPTEAMIQAGFGGAKSFTEQTFLRGLNQSLQALTDPERSFETWFSSMAGSIVPTIVADIARANDEIERRTVGPVQRVQARVPILREKLPPRIDVFGQDLPRYGGNVLEVMADPSRPSVIRGDVVVEELRRLAKNDIKVTPTLLGGRDGFDVLTVEENTQLWRRAGELMYPVMLALVNSPAYNALDDFARGEKIKEFTNLTKSAAKAEMAGIKLNQGVSIIKLAESGLLSVEELDKIQFYLR